MWVTFSDSTSANAYYYSLANTFEKIRLYYSYQYLFMIGQVTQSIVAWVDGDLTLDENLADNVGLQIAYSIFKNWAKENKKEFRLPGLR
ncbi:hypothetical protein TSAR_009105 [Trichomalopsis sarcophagae]|uniref:Peptidase M13 C-terminal domain-containing protein n=1 Tax=Trichomalopsis sarcophagae TaxID=543379 RepID=A0A232EY26_9HYME|nr:hypothetical protein TSAR_009105 [Trichomalopsis sarcophagae]